MYVSCMLHMEYRRKVETIQLLYMIYLVTDILYFTWSSFLTDANCRLGFREILKTNIYDWRECGLTM